MLKGMPFGFLVPRWINPNGLGNENTIFKQKIIYRFRIFKKRIISVIDYGENKLLIIWKTYFFSLVLTFQ